MILNVDYVYEALVRHRRKHRNESHHYLATQPVEIREVPASAAPVALRVHDNRLRDGEPKTREYRLFEDALWLPARAGRGSDQAGVEWLREAATAAGTSPYEYGNPFGATVQNKMAVRGRREDDETVVALADSNQDARAAGVRAAAAEYVLVDGVVHSRAPEPVYEVHAERDFAFVHVRAYSPPEKGADGRFGTHHFRADERGYMESAYPLGGYAAGEMPSIEVLLPEAVRAPIAEQALHAAAAFVRDDLGKKVLDGDVGTFVSYAALRDAVRTLGAELAAGGAAPVCDAVASALAGAVETLGGIDGKEGGRLSVEWAGNALARLQEREVSKIPSFGS
jgi:hypothetical protein